MKLLNLAGRVCCEFNLSSSDQMRTVQKVKDNHSRDVVTELDMRLHAITQQFVLERIPHGSLLSEEDGHDGLYAEKLLEGDWVIVDPLDGSNNHALDLPNFGYMAAQLRSGHIVGAVIVLPEYNQYIVLEDQQILYAQPLRFGGARQNGTVYYAYPPRQDTLARQARGALLDLIDTQSAGMYRYGSACVGLYHLLCGKHMAFIGHEIRIWDVVAFLPLLASNQIEVRYRIEGFSITLLASTHADFLENAALILNRKQSLNLRKYFHNDALKVDA